MTQIKDDLSLRAEHDVNLGAVPDAGATPLAGGVPETGGGFLAQGLRSRHARSQTQMGQVAQVGQSVADMMVVSHAQTQIAREIETEERRMATVQMQVESVNLRAKHDGG